MTTVGKASQETAMSAQDSAAHNSEAFQLTRLSSVLNGLEGGATVIHQHLLEAMRAVRSGNYKVDSTQLSQRIVGDALGSPQ